MSIECELTNCVDEATHRLFFGRVIYPRENAERATLLYCMRRYLYGYGPRADCFRKFSPIANGDNGVGSGQSARRLRVGHRRRHGTRLKAGNASQRRNKAPVRQKQSCDLYYRWDPAIEGVGDCAH